MSVDAGGCGGAWFGWGPESGRGWLGRRLSRGVGSEEKEAAARGGVKVLVASGDGRIWEVEVKDNGGSGKTLLWSVSFPYDT